MFWSSILTSNHCAARTMAFTAGIPTPSWRSLLTRLLSHLPSCHCSSKVTDIPEYQNNNPCNDTQESNAKRSPNVPWKCRGHRKPCTRADRLHPHEPDRKWAFSARRWAVQQQDPPEGVQHAGCCALCGLGMAMGENQKDQKSRFE